MSNTSNVSAGGMGCCASPDETFAESDNSACCSPECNLTGSGTQDGSRRLNVDFMYLDLDVCTRCQGTETSLEEAISEVARVLEATGVQVAIRKIHVQSEEQARELGFVSSPTIRINGRDIQLDVKESLCESCGDLCGEDVYCRVWVYQGKKYTVPPKAMIIDAILREVYGGAKGVSQGSPQTGVVPDNLKRFFSAKRRKEKQEEHSKPSCCPDSLGSEEGGSCTCGLPDSGKKTKGEPCPFCGQEGVTVSKTTVTSLLRTEFLSQIGTEDYSFCTNPACQAVYYQPGTGKVFGQDALRVKVWLRDPGDDVPLCYCHQVTRGQIKAAWQKGMKTFSEMVKATGISKAGCNCEKNNPAGRCCTKAIKQYMDELAKITIT